MSYFLGSLSCLKGIREICLKIILYEQKDIRMITLFHAKK
jgi:hypothetical protein